MKQKNLSKICFVLFIIFSTTTVSFSAESTDKSQNYVPTPAVVIPKTSFEFPLTVEGINITHNFSVQNKGSAPLEIQKIKTG